MSPTVLGIRGVTKYFGDKAVLRGVSFDVPKGHIFGILGPSGCGKTTLLRIASGLEVSTEGSVYLNGECSDNVPPSGRSTRMLFQDAAIFPQLSVSENMALAQKIKKVPASSTLPRVTKMAKLLKIGHLLDRKSNELSGGEKQRVAIGEVLVDRPDVVLFDEPFSHLDAELRGNIVPDVRLLLKELGLTALYVTHDQREAAMMCDTVAAIKDGEIHQVGAPEELYDSPQTRFVAEFVGTPKMNFFSMKCGMRALRLFLGGVEFMFYPNDFPYNLYADKNLVAGIRPEDIGFSADKSSVKPLVRVRDAQKVEGDLILTGEIGPVNIRMRVGSSDLGVKPGDLLQISSVKNVHIFCGNGAGLGVLSRGLKTPPRVAR